MRIPGQLSALHSTSRTSFIEYMGLATNPHAEALTESVTGLFYVGGVFGVI